jgi:Flp pilus assembly protein TadB
MLFHRTDRISTRRGKELVMTADKTADQRVKERDTMKKTLKRSGIILLLTVYLLVFTMPAAQAYIDPSATTYLIQAIAGVVIAVGSVAIIFWRRAKKKLKDKVGIDFDKNKETEEAVVAVKTEEEKQ